MKLFDVFDELDELRIDNVNGWGAVPDNQNVDYKGLRVTMRPSMFLRLAHSLPQAFTASDIEKHLRSDGAIGAPFLILAVPQDWFEGDLSLPAEIYGHEGRNRMTAAMRVEGDKPVEVHLFFGGGIRNRDLTPEIIDRLNTDVISQRGDLTKGPWFSARTMGETITVNLSKDPEYFGADVDDDDQDDYPIVQIPMDDLIGFEPDDKMLSPKSKTNMEKMIRLIKAGKGDKLPPILARRYRGGYQVLDGHHRYHAYKALNSKTIPAIIIPPENITGDIDESFRSNNAQREADDARTFSLRMTSTGVGHALEFADDSKSLYHKTPELDKELDIFKTRILDWLDKTIKDNMQEGVVAYNLVRRVAPWSWTELRTWWDDRKADILRTLLTMVQDGRFDAVYNLIMLHLRKKLGLKWPELDVIVNSCLTEIRRRSTSSGDLEEAWSNRYKKSINCSNPKGFSQKAHCAARRKRAKGGKTKSKPVQEAQVDRMNAIRDYLNQAMDYDQKNTEQSAREALQNRVWPFITKNIDTILSDKGDKGNGDYPTAAFAAWLLVQHMDAFPERQQEFLLHLEKTIPNHPKLRFLRDRVAVNQEIVRLWKSNPNGYLDKNRKNLTNPTVDVRDPNRFDDASKKAKSREEALNAAKKANNTLLVQAVTNTNALTQPSFTQVSENFAGDQKRQHLDFDNLYGKAFRITDAEGDPNRPGFSIVTPLNGNAWTDWKERPQFKSIVKQRLNDPNFLGDHKYQQIISAMTSSFDTKFIGRSGPVHEAVFDMKRYADQARSAIAVGWLDNAIQGMTYGVKVGKVIAAQPIKDLLDENKDAIIKYILKLMASHRANHKENYLEDVVSMLRKLEIDWPELMVIEKSIAADIKENFADGKGPGRPGDSRRHGIPKNATLAQLDKIGKGSGRKAQLARWQANMRRGRKKSVNEQKPNDHWVRYSKTLKDYLSKDDILDILGDLNAAVEDYGLTARPDITDAIEHNKDNIMRWMLSLMKRRPIEIADSLLSPSLRAFSKLGINWPELQVIKNSISSESGNSLRETIAPHGDPHNELKMLQAGTKPAALVNPWEFDKLYRPIIDGMGWEVIEYEIEGFDGHRFYVVAQPGEKARAQRIVQLVQYANRLVTAGGKVGPDYHRELGFLLGYKQADIDHFLRNMYGDEHVAEGDVIKTKFINKQAQKNKTPYVFNQEIADRIPLYDPKGRFGTYHKSGELLHGDEIPFSRFEVIEKNDRIASLIGVAPDGKKFVVSTSPPKLAHALADAFNRGGFTDLDLQPISLGPTRTDEEKQDGAALTVFDIDETLFHTAAKILVIKDGKVVKELDNRQFNTYILQDGESFDFSQFTNAQFFHDTSVPIETMWKRAKSTLDGIGRRPGSKVIIVTARSDFDDKEMFLNTFRKHGLDIDKIHVHRAGNLNMPSAAAKKKIIGQYLATGQFDMVRLFDDAESNLRGFLSLKDEFPDITFKAYMVLDDGSIREYRT